MKLTSLDIPSDMQELPQWLDANLASPNLTDLVTELLAIRNLPLTAPDMGELKTWFGQQREAFLQRGSRELSPAQRSDLLDRPWLLLALQEEIDQAGGDYWNELAWQSDDTRAMLQRIQTQVMTAGVRRDDLPFSEFRVGASGGQVKQPRRRRWRVFAALTAAAVLLIGVFVWRPQPVPVATAWGWNQRELFEGSPSDSEYLGRLADAGAKWRHKRPATKEAVAQRIREMRTGCQRLIDGSHPPLTQDQEMALKQLCRKWAGQFDQVLSDLETDKLTAIEARDAMDEIVTKLEKRLRSGELG